MFVPMLLVLVGTRIIHLEFWVLHLLLYIHRHCVLSVNEHKYTNFSTDIRLGLRLLLFFDYL